MRTEVLIVGGGPAGLATAIAARRQGMEAVVVDRARPPVDKACGEGLMPGGLTALARLGVCLERWAPFRGIRYLDRETVAEGRFARGHGAGVRRLELHRALVRRAEQVGVELRWGTRAEGLEKGGVATSDGTMRARWIVGADGLRSRLRRWAGLDGSAARRRRFGVRRHYAVEPWSDVVEVYWGDGCEAYVTPVAEREVGVAMLWSGRKADFDRLLVGFPRLAARIEGHAFTSRDRGAGPLRQRARRVTRGRLALVGDAAGYVDAITGEGLSLAFHQAEALADALAVGDPRRYARRHRRLAMLPETVTHLLLQVERRPALRRRLLRALAADPQLFTRLLSTLDRQQSLHLTTAPRLLWRIVAC